MTNYTPTQDDLDRFWSRVDQCDPADCWPWTAGTNSRGYGRIRWNGESESANRIAWMLTNGAIPEGASVGPTCGNPLCCNPAHLALGAKATRKAARTQASQPSAYPVLLSRIRRENAELRAEVERLRKILGEHEENIPAG